MSTCVATASTSGETATYDAAGDMQCRAPTSAVTCAGTTPTGASLNYDAERRLSHWQNALLTACVSPLLSCTLELTIAESDGIERGEYARFRSQRAGGWCEPVCGSAEAPSRAVAVKRSAKLWQ